MCVLVVAAIYASLMVVSQQNQLRQAGRYNIAWTAGRTINEYLRLETQIFSYADKGSDVDIDKIQLRLDILTSRVAILTDGDFADFTKRTPDTADIVKALSQALNDLQPIVDHLDDPSSVSKARLILAPLDVKLETLAGAAYQYSGERVADDQRQLFQLTWQFTFVAIGLFVCGFVLLGLLAWHNRLLGRAQASLEELAVNLQASALGLEKANLEILAVAQHDGLTGLVNRSCFHERLETALVKAVSIDSCVSMFYLDFDNFKDVNDSMGHPIGDAVLREVGLRLIGIATKRGTVARLGGDEFGLFVTDAHSQDNCEELACRLIGELSKPYVIEGTELTLGVSVGIAIAPRDGIDADELTKSADMALYAAKSEGKRTYKFFEAGMALRRRDRHALEIDLNHALFRGELAVHYQPIIAVKELRIIGFEALLRWYHPVKGFVPPSEFIPIAEESGSINAIGEWVFRQACYQAQSWPSNISVSINISSVQFRRKDLASMIRGALANANLEPRRLTIEITETVLLAKSEDIMATLHELRNLGIKIAMDDFGTGYSSLSYLTSFPFDTIKIDRAFVRELSSRKDCVTIVRSIASLGVGLQMTTTAEGVETISEFEQVAAAGCDQVQGYLFGRPQPAEGLTFELDVLPSLATAAE